MINVVQINHRIYELNFIWLLYRWHIQFNFSLSILNFYCFFYFLLMILFQIKIANTFTILIHLEQCRNVKNCGLEMKIEINLKRREKKNWFFNWNWKMAEETLISCWLKTSHDQFKSISYLFCWVCECDFEIRERAWNWCSKKKRTNIWELDNAN